ncbi:MAG TPA: VTT domain-containing protein [Casimicrobiaceae bacterium]|nr:VTT domain-containing protein [Casimicrobiaceae bacterium]
MQNEPCALSFGPDQAAPCAPRSTRILAPGRNCWRIEQATRLAFLVDGEEYFGAVRKALARARHSILILGWDIDSRMRLVPDGANDGLPEPLGEFLNAVVAREPDLHGYVLSWDFAMLYAMEREWLPIYKLDWRTHRRLSFRLDDRHPVGASHHQKVIVVDDALAFVSGYDLTRCRWDTSTHVRSDPRRVDHRGEAYPPFHDVGAMVTGDCARALGDLARERWHRATGHRPPRTPIGDEDALWPADVAAAARDIDVAISRTEPAFAGRAAVTEVRGLQLDAIANARSHLFAENQYFTSRTIADAFARRLVQEEGPEIAVLSPYMQSGWLEISTMGALRARIDHRLRAVDHHDRYRLYCPKLDWLDHNDGCLNVHSKVMVVDDALLTIGSANLSERSLGIDTECNLAIEAGGDRRIAKVIAGLRNRLLAEHLGTTADAVAAALSREGSLHRAIAALANGHERSLAVIEPRFDPALDALMPDQHVFDPEQPLDPDLVAAELAPQDVRSGTRARLIGTAAGVAALAVMAVAWRFTPLHQWLALDRLVDIGTAVSEEPWAPLAVLVAFVGAGLVAFPLLVLIAVTALVFGPWLGPVYTIIGATASAALTFGIGRRLGRETVRKLAGKRVNDLSRRLAKRGLIAIAFVRMLPIAPFSIVNVVAGASHIRWSDFLLGTVIGLLPGIVTMTFFVDRAIAALRDPGPDTLGLLALALALIVALAVVLRRMLRGRGRGDTSAPA